MKKTRKATKQHSIRDAVEIIDRLFIGNNAKLRAMADKALEDAIVGQVIYDARIKAGLSQKQLAKLIGSDQSVISRLEDADYESHSLSMLRRIAAALGKRVDIRFVDAA